VPKFPHTVYGKAEGNLKAYEWLKRQIAAQMPELRRSKGNKSVGKKDMPDDSGTH
jgi:hypothetical protein